MDFEFTTDSFKAIESEGKYFLEGIASTTDTDLQNESLTTAAIGKMAKSAIGLPLVKSHTHEVGDEIGEIVSAHAKDGKLHITAQLDSDDPEAVRYFKKISKSKSPVGFSIGGKGKGYYVGKARVIDEVFLQHIMVTNKPVNNQTFCHAISKALTELPEETQMTLEEMLATEELKVHIDSEIAKAVEAARTEEVAKSGATLSSATKATLKDIHTAGSPEVKAKVRSMFGEDADVELGAATEDTVGGVEKSVPDIAEMTKAIVEAVKAGFAETTSVVPKGSATIEPIQTEVAPERKDLAFGALLRKHFQPNGG